MAYLPWSEQSAAALQQLAEQLFACARASELSIETFEAVRCQEYFAPWRDLVDHAIEPNMFLDPTLAWLSALHQPEAARPKFISVWRAGVGGPRAKMIGLMALEPRPSILSRGLAQGWLHIHAACGAPLIHRDYVDSAIDALLDWVVTGERGCYGIKFSKLPRNGALFHAITQCCGATGRSWQESGTYSRAILTHDEQGRDAVQSITRAKRRKAFQRNIKLLSLHGKIKFCSTHGVRETMEAAEAFLALEASGWKGARGTALLCSQYDASFFRAATRLLAVRGQCRIDTMLLHGRPIAMGVLFSTADQTIFWKTAYDETYKNYSPGVVFTQFLTTRQLKDEQSALTDSCAIADHPMIDRLWPQRRIMADISICCDLGRAKTFHNATTRDLAWSKFRQGAKTILAGAFGYKLS